MVTRNDATIYLILLKMSTLYPLGSDEFNAIINELVIIKERMNNV